MLEEYITNRQGFAVIHVTRYEISTDFLFCPQCIADKLRHQHGTFMEAKEMGKVINT